MNQLIARNAAYWEQKLAAFFHDPPDKALHIPGHVKRGAKLINAFEIPFSLPDKIRKIYRRADAIASGMDRTQLPGFYQNGAVHFRSNPLLTHPSGANTALGLVLPETSYVRVTTPDTVSLIQQDMQTFSGQLRKQPDKFAASRFLYAHLLLRERLAAENIGGLGGLWYKLPADTRTPDHSIWQHCALVSALTSCFMDSDSNQASLMVVSLTPVQDFITRSRKLRDLWTSSVLLSWLTFEGVSEIVRLLGPDHILYPSLSGQPLIYWFLEHECGLDKFLPPSSKRGDKTVASFPNKFVCLVPTGKETKYAQKIQDAMRIAWMGIGDTVLSWLEKEKKINIDQYIRDQFKRQMESFFTCHWSACPLVAEDKQDTFKELLPESTWGQQLTFHNDSRNFKIKYPAKGEGAFYPVSHALIQSSLAAGKATRINERPDEPGIKCQLHGELEALRFAWEGDNTDKNPRVKNDPFWKALQGAWENTTDFKETERLSSVALVKRLVCMAVKQSAENHNHPLASFFVDAESFPSTTEMALADWLEKVEYHGLDKRINNGKRWKAALAQHVHTLDEGRGKEKEIDNHSTEVENRCRAVLKEMKEKYNRPVSDSDKYYAILLMDGDRMRDLVNGESIASKWSHVIHRDLIRRMATSSFDKGYHEFWQKHAGGRRAIAPAVHAAISEALGDFALHAVPAAIKKHRGRLIYAGGDDVCAILPASSALKAAKEIADFYQMGFVTGDENETVEINSDCWTPTTDRLRIHLGQGKMISISAGILIVHHKRPLSAAIRQARVLLEKAKEEGGRNAFALELAKRAGGSRFFVAQWDEKPSVALAIGGEQGNMTLLDHFHAIAMASADREGDALSSSLLFKFGDLQPGLNTVLEKRPDGLPALIIAMMRKKPEEKKWMRLAESAAAILGRRSSQEISWRLDHDPLIIARFLGPLMKTTSQERRTP
jgi:CRISPR-associated protein Cmr2